MSVPPGGLNTSSSSNEEESPRLQHHEEILDFAQAESSVGITMPLTPPPNRENAVTVSARAGQGRGQSRGNTNANALSAKGSSFPSVVGASVDLSDQEYEIHDKEKDGIQEHYGISPGFDEGQDMEYLDGDNNINNNNTNNNNSNTNSRSLVSQPEARTMYVLMSIDLIELLALSLSLSEPIPVWSSSIVSYNIQYH